MDLSLGIVQALIDVAVKAWRRLRYPTRVEIALDWGSPLVWDVSARSQEYWRVVSVEVTAGKDEAFIVAGGGIEARESRWSPWTEVAPLDHRHLPLPVEVGPQRAWEDHIAGDRLARVVERDLDPAGPVRLRIRVEDNYGSARHSNSLEVTVEELRREKVEHF